MMMPKTDINGIHTNIVSGSTRGAERQVKVNTKRTTLTSILPALLKLVIIAIEVDSVSKQMIWVGVGLGAARTGMRARTVGISAPHTSIAKL